MSKSKGKHEDARGDWHQAGDPFGGEKREKTGRRGVKTALTVLLCVLALALAAVALWRIFVVAPDVSDHDRPSTGAVVDPIGDSSQKDDEPATEGGRKADYFTFLLLGEDTSSESTDTIILVSYDVPNGTVNCMSIPRDTMVNVPWDIKRINSVYASKQGMDGLKEQIGNLTGITPDFHVIIQWKAVGRLVDALKGVWFDVPYDMDYDDPYQDLHIHQEKGYRLLDGDDAMQVVRWRKNNDGSNYGDTVRMEVQQAFLKAVASQCLQLKNWTKISEFAKIFAENVETDLPLNNLLWFAQKAMSISMENVSFMTMPGNMEGWAWSRTYKTNQSYVFPYPDEICRLVNEHFNPYLLDIAEEDLRVMYRNKDGSLGITNGTLADTAAGLPPVKPSTSSGTASTEKDPESPQEETPAAGEQAGETAPGGEQAGETAPGGEQPGGAAEGDGTATPGGETQGGETAGDPGLPAEPVLPPAESPIPSGETAVVPDESQLPSFDTQAPGWITGG